MDERRLAWRVGGQMMVAGAALGSLMRLSGASAAAPRPGKVELHGPAVPGLEPYNNVSGQGDVDALLSGLGM